MSTKTTGSKASYTRHSVEYKQESLKLAAQVSINSISFTVINTDIVSLTIYNSLII
jgi:hypothetical protein